MKKANEGWHVGSKLMNGVDRVSIKTAVISAGVHVCIKTRLPSASELFTFEETFTSSEFLTAVITSRFPASAWMMFYKH